METTKGTHRPKFFDWGSVIMIATTKVKFEAVLEAIYVTKI